MVPGSHPPLVVVHPMRRLHRSLVEPELNVSKAVRHQIMDKDMAPTSHHVSSPSQAPVAPSPMAHATAMDLHVLVGRLRAAQVAHENQGAGARHGASWEKAGTVGKLGSTGWAGAAYIEQQMARQRDGGAQWRMVLGQCGHAHRLALRSFLKPEYIYTILLLGVSANVQAFLPGQRSSPRLPSIAGAPRGFRTKGRSTPIHHLLHSPHHPLPSRRSSRGTRALPKSTAHNISISDHRPATPSERILASNSVSRSVRSRRGSSLIYNSHPSPTFAAAWTGLRLCAL